MRRSEEHTSELQSHSEISYAVFCLKKKKRKHKLTKNTLTHLHNINSTTTSNQFTSSNSAGRKKVESLGSWAGDTIQIRFSAKRAAGVSWWTNSRVSIDY